MANLIERARGLNPEYLYGALVHELADEIERLQALVAQGIEQPPPKRQVGGSSPPERAKVCARMECQIRGSCAYVCSAGAR